MLIRYKDKYVWLGDEAQLRKAAEIVLSTLPADQKLLEETGRLLVRVKNVLVQATLPKVVLDSIWDEWSSIREELG